MPQAVETTYQAPTVNMGNLSWQNAVISRTVSAPPGSPSIGDRYIIGSSPTGAWAGNANNIAQWTGTTWVIFTPSSGETAWVNADNNWYTYYSGSWQQMLTNGGLATIPQTQHGSPAGLAADIGGLLFINRGAGSNNNYCGGDLAGTVASVAYSVDITGYRSAAGQAATGNHSTVVGHDNKASGTNSMSFGHSSSATATDAAAIGYHAQARIADTMNFGAPPIIRKDNGDVGAGYTNFISFCGSDAILMSEAVDLSSGGASVTVNIPSGAVFYPSEVGVICIQQNGTLTAQPQVSYGNTNAGSTYYLAATATTHLSSPYTREQFLSLASIQGTAGTNGLTATVTTGGTTSGTVLTGRFYWRGILMEQ